VGTLGRHLDTQSSQNSPSAIIPPGTSIYDPTVPGHVPFPAFGVEPQFVSSTSTSNYNSFQAVFEHQISTGLTVLANYTFSKCLSDARSVEGANSAAYGGPFYNFTFTPYRAEWLPGFGKRGDYGLCAADTAQVVHASGTYYLPFGKSKAFLNNINGVADVFIGGWVTNFIFSHQTGQPFTILCPVSTTAGFDCYADIVPGTNVYGGKHDVTQWLNPAAFANPPVATKAGQSEYSPRSCQTGISGRGLQPSQLALVREPERESQLPQLARVQRDHFLTQQPAHSAARAQAVLLNNSGVPPGPIHCIPSARVCTGAELAKVAITWRGPGKVRCTRVTMASAG
jgi:hypothetical protein